MTKCFSQSVFILSRIHIKNTGKYFAVLPVLCWLLVFSATAQTTTFIPGVSDMFFRSKQLMGKISLENSLVIRSFSASQSGIDSSNEFSEAGEIKKMPASQIRILPLSVMNVYNSNHPYGWNDGSIIPSRGIAAKVSGGFQTNIGKFSIQFNPEFVAAQNSNFETFFPEHYDTTWSRYYKWLNRSDIPEQFGEKTYKKLFPGQSSIRYNTGSISLGLSTENMWWGPGTRNALIMSNNAPGFVHLTFNSTKPVQTKIGFFEWQIISGLLENSGVLPPQTNRYYLNGSSIIYQPKNNDTRYLSGMVLSWQPKWVAGLFVGFTKVSYQYQSDISGIADIFPLEGIIQSTSEKNGKKASLGSLFMRYVMPKNMVEFYMEYGRNDKSLNLGNLIFETGYPRAYVAGMRKLFTSGKNSFIEFATEFTQMQLPDANLIKDAKSWYLHDFVRQGYTNVGQVIGAGIGPGSNSQMLNITWIKGAKRVGLLFERIVRNNDFYYNAFQESKDFRRHWTDLSTTALIQWPYKKFLFSAQVAMIRSLNYQWWYIDYQQPVNYLNYFRNGYDVLNFNGGFSFSYRL